MQNPRETGIASAYLDLPPVLNANELAETLGISRAGAYNLLNSADFPTLHIGSRKMVARSKLLEWIDRNSNEGGGQIVE